MRALSKAGNREKGVFHVVFDDALKQSSLVGQVTNLPYQAWEECHER